MKLRSFAGNEYAEVLKNFTDVEAKRIEIELAKATADGFRDNILSKTRWGTGESNKHLVRRRYEKGSVLR